MKISIFVFVKAKEKLERKSKKKKMVLEKALEGLKNTLSTPFQLQGTRIEDNLDKVIDGLNNHLTTLTDTTRITTNQEFELA